MKDDKVYLIEDHNIAAENEMRGDGAAYYCDNSGKVHKSDLLVTGAAARDKAVKDGGSVIGEFASIRSLIYFGMDLYEGQSKADDFDIVREMSVKGYTAVERNAVAMAHSIFTDSPLPPSPFMKRTYHAPMLAL